MPFNTSQLPSEPVSVLYNEGVGDDVFRVDPGIDTRANTSSPKVTPSLWARWAEGGAEPGLGICTKAGSGYDEVLSLLASTGSLEIADPFLLR